jgi:hypothetical protein
MELPTPGDDPQMFEPPYTVVDEPSDEEALVQEALTEPIGTGG